MGRQVQLLPPQHQQLFGYCDAINSFRYPVFQQVTIFCHTYFQQPFLLMKIPCIETLRNK
jgi:hypothetical protein